MSIKNDEFLPLIKDEKDATCFHCFASVPIIIAAFVVSYIRGFFAGEYAIRIAVGLTLILLIIFDSIAVCSRRYRFDDEGIYVLWLGRFTTFHKWNDFTFTGIITLSMPRMRRGKALACTKKPLKRDQFGLVDITFMYCRPFSSCFLMNTPERYDAFRAHCPADKFSVFL